MLVYGLSGKSGTGKSYHASELCAKYQIRGLIDDGLFMMDGNIIAGVSAKKQATSMAAIKTAIFTSDKHCEEVKDAIKKENPDKILILGTSDRMIEKVAQRLELDRIYKMIHIEDITTEAEREKALKFRNENGMHIIPAPTFQVRKQFSGYFLDPRKSFGKDTAIEKTIVRPTYSYLGDFIISEKVITDIVEHIGSNMPGIAEVLWTAFDNDEQGCVVRTVVLMNKDSSFMTTAESFQAEIFETVKEMTAFNVLGVEVEIRGYK